MPQRVQTPSAPASYLSVLERHRMRLNQEPQQQLVTHSSKSNSDIGVGNLEWYTPYLMFDEAMNGNVIHSNLSNGWPDFGAISYQNIGSASAQAETTNMVNNSVPSRTPNGPSNRKIGGSNAAEENVKSKIVTEDVKQETTKSSKRKGMMTQSSTEDTNTSLPTKVAEKMDYIHVRARRGQATDSHSLAERVRRERISERMRYLQELVPGCNKVTGKAGMLDEIINYVQSLQKQVEFLSMKLAAVNPVTDFSVDDLIQREISQMFSLPPGSALSTGHLDPSALQFYCMQQAGIQIPDPIACGSVPMSATPLNSCLSGSGCSSWDVSVEQALQDGAGQFQPNGMDFPFQLLLEGDNMQQNLTMDM